MYFNSIRISQYRNLTDIDLNLSNSLNLIVGPNGQGKTNFIEAIFQLIRGESFRFGTTKDFLMKGRSRSIIRGQITKDNIFFDLHLDLQESKKTHSLNSKKVTASTLPKLFPVIIFSPESLECIKEGSEFRRKLIDDLVLNLNPQYGVLLDQFKRALKTRNRILKDIKEKKVSVATGIDILESITSQFVMLAASVTESRIRGLHTIKNDFQDSAEMIFNKPVDISVEYVISGKNASKFNTEQITEILYDRLRQLKEAEISTGSSLVGPQKHDINFLYAGNDSRIYCSQGQQRALILSFKIAQIVHHKKAWNIYPLLILDDVLSELDSERRNSLIRFLQNVQAQIFVTATDEFGDTNFLGKDVHRIIAKDGNLTNVFR